MKPDDITKNFIRIKVMKPTQYIGKALFIVFILSAPLFAEIYSWVDENGVRHFGNTNPTDQRAEIEVQEEIERDQSAGTVKKDNTAWRERMEQKKAAEEAEKKNASEQRIAEEQEKKAENAYLTLKKIEDHLVSGVEWTEYKALLFEARSAVDRIGKKTIKTTLLTEVCECYEIPLELRRFYNVDKMKSVNKILKKMNEEWETDAKTYHSGRALCWERASDKLKEYDSFQN